MAIPAASFFLDPDALGTLQQQIQEMVAEGIVTGRLRPGEKLPSSRGLAAHLGVGRITVTLAYTELIAADFIVSRGRSGYFVSENAPRHPDFASTSVSRRDLVDWARVIGERHSRLRVWSKPQDWRQYPYSFIYGQADPTLFDHQNWRTCALRALGMRDFEALTTDYYERDDPLLIEYITRVILPRRGINSTPDEILLTLGAQNALWLTARVLLTPDRLAAIENPCYPGLRVVLGEVACRYASVNVDGDGMSPEALPLGVDVVFTTASHQSPTNTTMSMDRRGALLRKAASEDFLVVEDDYEFEMPFLKASSPALKSLDREGRVIYVGSFSKSLFPGLRLGFLVGSAAFIREARALRSIVYRHPPGHVQRTVAYYLSLGHYDAHLNRLSAAYKRRRTVMDEAIKAEGLTPASLGGFGGSSFWMEAPKGVDTELLANTLKSDGVLIEPGRAFFDAPTTSSNTYRLAYSSISHTQIPEGIRRLAVAIRRASREA